MHLNTDTNNNHYNNNYNSNNNNYYYYYYYYYNNSSSSRWRQPAEDITVMQVLCLHASWTADIRWWWWWWWWWWVDAGRQRLQRQSSRVCRLAHVPNTHTTQITKRRERERERELSLIHI